MKRVLKKGFGNAKRTRHHVEYSLINVLEFLILGEYPVIDIILQEDGILHFRQLDGIKKINQSFSFGYSSPVL
jgi:hypothetical protein